MKVKEFSDLGETILALKQECKEGTLLGLKGDLGYGKTYLVAALLRSFSCELTHSPTFSLVNRYYVNNSLLVYHMDLYRLKSSEEMDSAGIWDLFSDCNSLFIIEWIDRMDLNMLPLNLNKIIVEISKKSDDSRHYKLSWL